MKRPVPDEYVLKGIELRLVREALDEAIESVKSALDSGLPPNRDFWSAHDRHMFQKWGGRLMAYRALLKSLGGKVGGETTSLEVLLPQPEDAA